MWSLGVVVDPPGLDDLSASFRLLNRCSLRHSSRRRPMKLSAKPFCCGLAVTGPLEWSSCMLEHFRAD